jgi:subtilase family serine protease
MLRKYRFVRLLVITLGFLLITGLDSAQVELGQPSRRVITQPIDENKRVTLAGNTRPEANATNDRGAVPDDFSLEHLQLQLQLPSEKEQQLEQLIQELHDPNSPNFHQWLTPDQFRQEFSLATEDINTITHWLQSQGFTVNVIYPRSIDFSGTAAQVRAAFKTEIHNLDVDGAKHIANMTDPQIPAALAPAIVGVVSLNDFMPHPANRRRASYTVGNGDYLMVPADLATIYNFNPLFSKSVSGQGQTIVVIEDTDLFTTADWTTFRSTLGLSGYTSGTFTTIHPAPPTGMNNCSDPGVNADDSEAILDAEWASAGAPSAAIVLASCTDTTNFGGFIALQNLLNESSTPPAIVSISYGESEPDLGASTNAAINALYQQAVTEGVSVFVSAGDEGAASSDADLSKATHGISVSGFTSTPYNVSVGGTDFGDSYTGTNSTYWASSNTATYGSAVSYIPEIPWNDSCAGVILATYLGYATTYGTSGFCNSSTGSEFLTTASGSGGPSGCATGTPGTGGVVSGTCMGYAKPSWQTVLGNPTDSLRDIPDVSLFAANGIWGHYYVTCYSDTANGGASCAGAPNTWSGFGGTSISSPIMAAIQALVNQTTGSSAGNPNSTYYSLARAEYGSGGDASCNSSLGNGVASTCVFYDVTAGDMDVNCTGTHNCYLDSATHGVLSLSNTAYQPAYGTQTGWDFATGIGTVNAYNLVNSWPKSSNPAVLNIISVHTGNFTQGQQNATYLVTVSNGASAGPTSGTVTVTETVPAGLTLVSMVGTGWTCGTTTCTRSDVLNGGLSYPAITVTVNVASNASSPQVNQVSVSGGGSAPANANDSTVIIALPVLSIAKTHTGNFTQGQQNATYTVTVSNGASGGPTSGTVTVTETAPPGLTLVSMVGTGWTCGTTTCTRSDVLNGGLSYPVITVAVNVASNASSPQVNQVSVSGGDSATANASNSTTITVAVPAAPTGLTATAGNGQVSLTWNASVGATSYNVYSSTTNGGPYTEITSVATTSYTNTGLTNGTTYYYVVTAVSSGGTSGNSNQASAMPAGGSGFSNGYANMRPITISHLQVPNTNQTNFPVLISLPANTYADLKTTSNGGSVTNANGYDILFTSDAGGTLPLAYERESYSGSTGAMIDWVKVATLSHTTDTVIYMFYGNASVTTDQSNATGTWNSNYQGVWHLPNGTTLTANDSTSNGNNASFIANGTTATTGQIDGGASMPNSNSYVSIPDAASLRPSTVTVSAWLKVPPGGAGYYIILDNSGAGISYALSTESAVTGGSGYMGFNSYSGSSYVGAASSYSAYFGAWTQVVGTYDGTTWKIYFNGALANSSATGSITYSASAPLYFGYLFNVAGLEVDEVRISNTARSADWITTEYNNQNSPSTFYSVGAAVMGGGSSSPAITSLSTTTGAVGASVTISGSNFGSSQGTSTVQFDGGFASSARSRIQFSVLPLSVSFLVTQDTKSY